MRINKNNNNNIHVLYHQPVGRNHPGKPRRKWLDI
jgi:hypothetical protein